MRVDNARDSRRQAARGVQLRCDAHAPSEPVFLDVRAEKRGGAYVYVYAERSEM